MVDWDSLRFLLPKALRGLPADLLAVCILTILTIISVLAPGIRETPIRVVLGLPFVLFIPGYAFVAALFPEAGTASESDAEMPTETTPASTSTSGIDGIERVALSFGLSIAIVPLLGLALNFTPWGIRLVPILVSVSGFTLVATAIAAKRRWKLLPAKRFSVPYRSWLATAREELLEPATRTDAALNILLAVSVVLAFASVGYAVAVPKQGERFTEFYLLTEDEGELVAADYPTEFVRGEGRPLVVGIENQEHRRQNYSIVVKLQRVNTSANSTTLLEERRLGRLQTRLAHNTTWRTTYRVVPTMTGQQLRLAFLLYKGNPPTEPTVDNAYRELHLWVNVTEGS